MKGNLTIEAAYVIPFCFLVFGLVSFLGIYLYNKSVLEMTGYECILQSIEEREQNEELFKEQLYQKAERAAIDRIFGLTELQVSLRITNSNIVITYQGKQSLIGVPINVDAMYERTNPELILRMIKGVSRETYE